MKHLFLKIEELLQQGQPLVQATIIWVKGSAPRHAGAKCLVLEDGSLIGSIGGGLLEYRTTKKAQEIIYQGIPCRYLFQLTGQELLESDMLCGGEAEVYLEPLDPSNQTTRTFFHQLANIIKQNKTGWILTLLIEEKTEDSLSSHGLLTEDNEIFGDLPVTSDDLFDLTSIGKPGHLRLRGPECQVFVEPIKPDNQLIIFGGGHIAQFVAQLAKMVDFRVTVIDNNEDFANNKRFPTADQIIITPFEQSLLNLNVSSNTYMAILTRGHASDYTVLRQALLTYPAYIGMIASKIKRDMIFEKLINEGYTKERLKDIYSPIGLNIGAQSPEEIAISIVAELIKVKEGHI